MLTTPSVQAVVTPEWRQEAESFSTKSTGAQFSDANASGGAAWNIWTNGYLQTSFTATSAGVKQVDVVARGSAVAGVWPTMRISMDGTPFAEVTVNSASYQTYSAITSAIASGSHTLKIEFTNDAMSGGEDRNLKVDVVSVLPSNVEESDEEAEAMTHTAGGLANDTSASGGKYWNLWSNGYAETTTLNATTSSTKQIVVYARGDVAGGVWPNMRIWVNGVQYANHSVNTTTWQPYVTTATLAKGNHTLRIEFTNDGVVGSEDRNLKVDVADLVPVPHEWRQEAESFATKTAGASTASTLASGGTFWNLWSNGHLSTPATTASDGRKEIRITARGIPAGGIYPQLKVWVGTTLVTTLTVNVQTFTQWVVPATTTRGTHTLKLEYVNDGIVGSEDRNVHVDAATIVGDNAFPFVKAVATPANNSYVPAQPALRAVYGDPDGDAGFVDFEVYNNATGVLVASGRSTQVNEGYIASWTPAALVNGTAYKWRARAYDGAFSGASWTAYQLFTVDSVAPVAPSVSSTTFPTGSWSGTDTTSGSFTFAPGASSDVVGYKYGLDENPPTDDTTATTVTLTPGEGPHHLYVQSVDRAGNLSAVTDYAFNVGSGAVTTPRAGDTTAKRLVLKTSANPTMTSVTYHWRRAAADAWATIPAGDVTLGGVPVTWPVALAGGTHADLVWNAATTLGSVDGPFEMRAQYNTGATTRGTRVQLDQKTGGASAVPAGPGSVNLLTGNLAVGSTDIEVPAYSASLSLARSFSSRDPNAGATGPFGPGWVTGLSVDGANSAFTGLAVSGNLRTITIVTGETIGFTASSTSSFTPEPGLENLTLTRTAGSGTPTDQTDDVYELADLGGDKTVFTWQSTAFVPTTVVQPGSNVVTTLTYQTVGGVTRITRALAPVPAGVTCTNPDTTRGCRSVTYDYAPSSTPVPGPGGGDYANRLRSVSLVAWNPATSAMATTELVRYSYNPDGRLMSVWNPALSSLKTTYTYDANGRLATMTPAGEEPWSFAYTTLPSDPDGGRLKSVSRSALAAGTAVTTYVYDVPLSGTGAPADLSGTQLARWGQTDVPVDATAVFPATQVPDGDQPTGVMPSSYERAAVHYLNVAGRTVDLLAPGGHLAVKEYDAYGNPVRDLTAANRARALNASSTDTAAQEAALASRYSTVRTFASSGQRLVDELGPEHEVTLVSGVTDSIGRVWAAGALVRARAHTVNTYDQGAPPGTYHLVTTSVTSARIADTTTDTDSRTTTIQYDWDLRQPTGTTKDPGGLGLVSRAAYDSATGLLTKETRPSGTSAQDTAATTVYSYYTVGAHPTYSDCGNKPEWANLVCRTDLAAQPTVTTGRPAIPSKVVTYDMFGATTSTAEKDGATTLRTTTVTFDSAHRPWKMSTTGTGDALETVETSYSATTGKPVESRTLNGTGAVTSQVVRAFDTLGRITSYTDADGNVSTTTYDILSRPVTTGDGKGTQTRYYDEGSERRGVVSRLVDSAAGTFTATYDADGQFATVTSPNNLVRTTTRDETGAPTRVAYAKGGSTWLSFDMGATIHGQLAASTSSGLSSQAYTYDAAGRLTKVADTLAGSGCSLRSYTFDADSNRTSLVARQPSSEGECDPGGAASTTTWTHDAASRLTTSGYVYDALGRTTSVPAGDGAGVALTATYWVNGLVHTVSPQDGSTATWTLDPMRTRFRARTQDGVTKVNHYADDGDSPAWVDEGGGAWTRNILGIDGSLAAVQDSASGVLLQLVNPHGDVVGTSTTDTAGTAPTATFGSTETGTPRDGVNRRYGWLGGQQRGTDPTGVVLMGARVYNPSTGRFLQVDPVSGGSANDYDYGNADPVNQADTSGLWSSKCAEWGVSVCQRYENTGSSWWSPLARRVYYNFSADDITRLQEFAQVGHLVWRGLDWTQNGCSWPGEWVNRQYGNLWGNSCRRHDFGYRNHWKMFHWWEDWPNPWGKNQIDGGFKSDMRAACVKRYPNWWQYGSRLWCYGGANIMYEGVQKFGGFAYLI